MELGLNTSNDWNEPHYMDVDGQKVELRRRGRNNMDDSDVDIILTPSPASTLPPTSLGSQPAPVQNKSQEPNIDFELDVKVLINSGKCVLHTKDPAQKEEDQTSNIR